MTSSTLSLAQSPWLMLVGSSYRFQTKQTTRKWDVHNDSQRRDNRRVRLKEHRPGRQCIAANIYFWEVTRCSLPKCHTLALATWTWRTLEFEMKHSLWKPTARQAHFCHETLANGTATACAFWRKWLHHLTHLVTGNLNELPWHICP